MWLLLCWLVCVVCPLPSLSLPVTPEPEPPSEVSSPLHVAQCRATCLKEMLDVPDCSLDSQCSTCWRNCELLEKGRWRRLKSVSTICSTSDCERGCRLACGFHLLPQPSQSAPVVPRRRKNLLSISPGRVDWPEGKDAEGLPLVYVLIQQLPHSKWVQVTQTTKNYAGMGKSLWEKLDFGVREVRVLAVSSKGLEAIYYPMNANKEEDVVVAEHASSITTNPPISTTATEDEIWGKMMKVDQSSPPHPQEEEQGKEEEDGGDKWNLRRLSLIHQKSLVIAELAWNELKEGPDQEYLITWELDGGGLKGHLVTDSTTVSLSLWPDTLYHIQVELFTPSLEEGESEAGPGDDPVSRSLALRVDTGEAGFPLLESPSALSSLPFSLPTTAVITGSLVVLLLITFALGLLLLVRGRRGGRGWSEKLLEEAEEVGVVEEKEASRKNELGVAVISKGLLPSITHPKLNPASSS